jgi:hypothetical protein
MYIKDQFVDVKEIYYADSRTDSRMICGKCLTKACDFDEHEHPATMRTKVAIYNKTTNNKSLLIKTSFKENVKNILQLNIQKEIKKLCYVEGIKVSKQSISAAILPFHQEWNFQIEVYRYAIACCNRLGSHCTRISQRSTAVLGSGQDEEIVSFEMISQSFLFDLYEITGHSKYVQMEERN